MSGHIFEDMMMVQLNVHILNLAFFLGQCPSLPLFLLYQIALLRFIYYKVHPYFKVYNSVIFIQKGVHWSPLSNSRTFTSPKKETLCPLAISLHSSLTPSPWQPLIYLMSLWRGLFWTFHISVIIQYIWRINIIWFTNTNIFSHYVDFLFTYLIVSFEA